MARPSKKAAATAQSEKSVADAAWSKVFPAQDGLSRLSLLSAVHDLQGKYSRPEAVTPHDERHLALDDDGPIPFARLMDDLAQLRVRLPPLLETLGVVFDDRTPKRAMKQWELKPPSRRGPAPKPLPSRFDFDLTNCEPREIPSLAAFKHLRGIVDEIAAELHHAAMERRELPDGWKGKTRKIGLKGTEEELEQLPDSPIQNFQHLRTWLESLLNEVRHPWLKPAESYLDDVQRELRNARIWLRWKGAATPTLLDEDPSNIRDAERRLEKLIDWLGTKPLADSSSGNGAGGGEINEAGQGADKANGQTDTPKKTERKSKRRQPYQHSNACVRKFKKYKRDGDPQSMLYVVREYVSENPQLFESSLYRTLTDNSDQWKT